MIAPSATAEQRVLVLAPTGRDAGMLQAQLVADGMTCEVCADVSAVLAGIEAGAGAAVVAKEALPMQEAERLAATLEAQEPWSDIPVLLLSEVRQRGLPSVYARFFERSNVTLLQRPMGVRLFLSAVRSALRARRRQYQMRDLYRDLERAVELRDLFVSILGHDLRTPLSAIELSAQLIRRVASDPQVDVPAGRILNSSRRVSRMVVQLLDLARLREGAGLPLAPRPVHLGELCRQVVSELMDAEGETLLEVRETGDPRGEWDADRLAQVVSNLAANAVRHGVEGRPITVEVDGSAASRVRLRVHNVGELPPEALPTLFEPFKQAATGRGAGEGLGLGLFIAREIARAHGGGIRAWSREGRTTFEVTLPRVAAPEGGAG